MAIVAIDFARNDGPETQIIDDVLQLGPGASLTDCRLDGPAIVGAGSVLRRVQLGRFVGLGARCSIVDAAIGPFGSIGDHVIINAGDHPTDWLSTGMFQYARHPWAWSGALDTFEIREKAYRWRTPMQIGADVWIASNATLMTGASVGHGAVIGAHAFLKEAAADYAIMAGAPAREIRKRFDPELIERLLASQWWDAPMEMLSGLPFDDVPRTLDLLEQRRDAER